MPNSARSRTSALSGTHAERVRADRDADDEIAEDRRKPQKAAGTTTTTAAASSNRMSCSVCGIGRIVTRRGRDANVAQRPRVPVGRFGYTCPHVRRRSEQPQPVPAVGIEPNAYSSSLATCWRPKPRRSARSQRGSATAFLAAVRALSRCRGRVVVSGIGKSGHIARKLAATLASTGTPAFFVHPAEASHGDLGMITADDVVLLLSNSGETDELVSLVAALQAPGRED